jgi:hypothetical protein
MYTCIKHLDQYFIWVRHHHYLMFFVRSRMTPQKTNLWISSRDTCEFPHVIYDVIFLWRHFDAVIMTSYFLTSFWRRHYDVIFLWRHFDAVIMTSYFCDVILTPSLWRYIFVTSFWRRHYDVIFLWRHFDAVIMTSYHCDVISSPELKWWRAMQKHWKRHTIEKCIMRSWICSFHLPSAEAFACCWKPVVVISSFYVGLHFVVWK